MVNTSAVYGSEYSIGALCVDAARGAGTVAVKMREYYEGLRVEVITMVNR